MQKYPDDLNKGFEEYHTVKKAAAREIEKHIDETQPEQRFNFAHCILKESRPLNNTMMENII